VSSIDGAGSGRPRRLARGTVLWAALAGAGLVAAVARGEGAAVARGEGADGARGDGADGARGEGADGALQAPFVIAPYVQDVRSDGFTVVFDSAGDDAAEVIAGDVHVATRGPHHEAVVGGVAGGAAVHYRVLIAGHERAAGDVRLPDPARPLTFVVYGDTRNFGDELGRLAERVRRLDPALLLFTGDIAPHGSDDDSWVDFFAAQAPLLADVPLYPALGNHELFHDPLATLFRRHFALPDRGRERLYYQLRWGPAAFVFLDGNAAPDPAQLTWLAATLAAAERDHVAHVFVVVHQPALSVSEHCGSAVEQAAWVELFERYRVRAVFAGHDHVYERMERNGVRYFVSGGAGAPLYGERTSCAPFDRAARRAFRAQHHFLRVRIDGAAVTVSALPLDDGPPLDEVRYAAGEPLFAADAPSLEARPPQRPWLLGSGALVLVLVGVAVRRRRR
jgi:calcineurin-like phosphoesterase family protein